MSRLLLPFQVDDAFGWRPGTAERLARANKIEHIRITPTGDIRFDPERVKLMVRVVVPSTDTMRLTGGTLANA